MYVARASHTRASDGRLELLASRWKHIRAYNMAAGRSSCIPPPHTPDTILLVMNTAQTIWCKGEAYMGLVARQSSRLIGLARGWIILSQTQGLMRLHTSAIHNAVSGLVFSMDVAINYLRKGSWAHRLGIINFYHKLQFPSPIFQSL